MLPTTGRARGTGDLIQADGRGHGRLLSGRRRPVHQQQMPTISTQPGNTSRIAGWNVMLSSRTAATR